MSTLRNSFLAVCSAVLLCAFSYPTVLQAPQSAPVPSFEFLDARPAFELKTEFESLMVSNCAYGSVRIGARDMTPDPMLVVRDELASRMNDRLSGRKLTLRYLDLHFNAAAASRQAVAAVYSGAIPRALNNVKTVGCAPDDVQGGYVPSEVAEGMTPVILVIEVELDGQSVHSRCVVGTELKAPPRKGLKSEELHAQWNAVVDQAFKCGMDRLSIGLAELLERQGNGSTAAPGRPGS